MEAYKAWNRRDAENWRAFQAEEISRDEWRRRSKADPPPETPSDDDFKYEDGRLSDEKEVVA